MEKRNVKRQAGKILAAAAATAGLAAFGASKADASLIVDVRASQINGVNLASGADVKNVTLLQGQTITMDVIARLQGQNSAQVTNQDYDGGGENDVANDDALQILVGSMKSSVGGLLGNMQIPNPKSVWKAPGFILGTQLDSDGDTDLDIGQFNSTDPSTMWNLRAAGATAAATFTEGGTGYTTGLGDAKTKIINASTSELFLGQVKFVATGSGGSTGLNFVIRPGGDAGSALWFEDGAATSINPNTGTFSVGTPVNVTVAPVPEPASIGLLGLASVGLLARRRDKKA